MEEMHQAKHARGDARLVVDLPDVEVEVRRIDGTPNAVVGSLRR